MQVGPIPGEDQKKKPYTQPIFGTFEATGTSARNRLSLSRTAWDRLKEGAVRLFETVLFEPPSRTQTEQLARKILDYGVMNRRGPEPTVIHLPEMAIRFREPRRNVRQSLELLEEHGAVERTDSKDDWKLTTRLYSPIRNEYAPPRISGPYGKTPPNPPSGWIELQNRAHRAKNAQEFNEIIAEMNRLLSTPKKISGDEDDTDEFPAQEANHKPVLKPNVE